MLTANAMILSAHNAHMTVAASPISAPPIAENSPAAICVAAIANQLTPIVKRLVPNAAVRIMVTPLTTMVPISIYSSICGKSAFSFSPALLFASSSVLPASSISICLLVFATFFEKMLLSTPAQRDNLPSSQPLSFSFFIASLIKPLRFTS